MTLLRTPRRPRLLPVVALGASLALTLGTACAPGKKDDGGAAAGDYPTKPVELLVPAAPGGGWDQTATRTAAGGAGSEADRPEHRCDQPGGWRRRHRPCRAHHQRQGQPRHVMIGGLVMIGALKKANSPL